MSEAIDWVASTFAKTPAGQLEIQTRSLGLAPLVRRVLVLVNGQRSGQELAAFVPAGEDIAPILAQLVAQGCVLAQAPPPPAADPPPAPGAALDGLPPADSRSAQDNEKARNFMINAVNTIIGHHMRISLVHDIFHAQGTEQLRVVYRAWAESMSHHAMGARRLPELREQLFKVL
jgi:hypothetical protein